LVNDDISGWLEVFSVLVLCSFAFLDVVGGVFGILGKNMSQSGCDISKRAM
jgi:hypothetical protein